MPQRSVTRRWSGVPAPAAAAAAIVWLALLYGAVLHLVEHITGDRTAYVGAPIWLATYYGSLVLLDPIAALLFALRSRPGVVLAAVVLTSNALANGYANFVLSSAQGVTVGRAAVLVIGVLAAALLIATPQIWPRR